jgi:hypothetical protein
MDLKVLDRLPKKQSAAFLALLADFRNSSSAGILLKANKKRSRPPTDERAGEIFAALLFDCAHETDADLWPGWERWAGPYAQKCYAEDCRRLSWFIVRILLVALVVIVGLAVGAGKGGLPEMPWLPLVAGAWIVFSAIGLGASMPGWLRFRGTGWPATPDDAEKWEAASHFRDWYKYSSRY